MVKPRPWWDEVYLNSDAEIEGLTDLDVSGIRSLLSDLHDWFKTPAYRSGVFAVLIFVVTAVALFFGWVPDSDILWVLCAAALAITVCATILMHSLIWAARFKWRTREADRILRQYIQASDRKS